MSINEMIKKIISKIYQNPIENPISYKFYNDLFTGYEFILNDEDDFDRNFYKILFDDNEMVDNFDNDDIYDFLDNVNKVIDGVIYSLGIYGVSYVYIKPKYSEENNDKCNIVNTISFCELMGIFKKDIFYRKTQTDNIIELDISEGKLVVFDLKDLGFKRKYFKNIAKRLARNKAINSSLKLISSEPTYNYDVHIEKYKIKLLKQTKDIGWINDVYDLSDSYILYKKIQMIMFKKRILQYVIDKLNLALEEFDIFDKSFKIVASIKEIDYEEMWTKFQNGEITISELSNIIFINN